MGGDEGEGGPDCFLSTPTVRRHSPSSDASVIMTALDGGARTLPHRRGRGLQGRFEIFLFSLQHPYDYGLISKIDPDFSSPVFFYIAQTVVVKLWKTCHDTHHLTKNHR